MRICTLSPLLNLNLKGFRQTPLSSQSDCPLRQRQDGAVSTNTFLFFLFRLLRFRETAAPSSPVHNRRMLTARNARMSSVVLPDENEKSVSSASTSPCHSPVSTALYYVTTWPIHLMMVKSLSLGKLNYFELKEGLKPSQDKQVYPSLLWLH